MTKHNLSNLLDIIKLTPTFEPVAKQIASLIIGAHKDNLITPEEYRMFETSYNGYSSDKLKIESHRPSKEEMLGIIIEEFYLVLQQRSSIKGIFESLQDDMDQFEALTAITTEIESQVDLVSEKIDTILNNVTVSNTIN